MFLDTSGLFCLPDGDDFRHVNAVRLYTSATRLLIHSYIFVELVPLFQSRGADRQMTLEFLSDILEEPIISTVWGDEALSRSAISLLESRMDKTDSLCDAVSFLLMRHYSDLEALTTDHHFEQERFRQLLAS